MVHSFIPVPNVARAELMYQMAGSTVENVINVQKASPFSFSDLQALRGVIDTWDSTTWKNSRGPHCVLFRIRTKALDTASSPEEDYYLPSPRAGTLPGAGLPGNVTLAIKLQTALAGRSFRGRWYLTGITTINYGANVNEYDTASANAIVSWLNALRTALATAGYTLGVVSYYHSHAWRTTGVFTPAIGYTIVDYHLDSMRRRLTGRGI
jgi:hypothetical protein